MAAALPGEVNRIPVLDLLLLVVLCRGPSALRSHAFALRMST